MTLTGHECEKGGGTLLLFVVPPRNLTPHHYVQPYTKPALKESNGSFLLSSGKNLGYHTAKKPMAMFAHRNVPRPNLGLGQIATRLPDPR